MASSNIALRSLPGAPPKYDLAGPTIDDDIRRLIGRYGAQTVKEAATRLTKAKRGRKKIPDFAELADVLVEDARADWRIEDALAALADAIPRVVAAIER